MDRPSHHRRTADRSYNAGPEAPLYTLKAAMLLLGVIVVVVLERALAF